MLCLLHAGGAGGGGVFRVFSPHSSAHGAPGELSALVLARREKAALPNLLFSALIAGRFFSSLFFKLPLAEKAALALLLNLFVCPSAACFQRASERNCLLC